MSDSTSHRTGERIRVICPACGDESLKVWSIMHWIPFSVWIVCDICGWQCDYHTGRALDPDDQAQ